MLLKKKKSNKLSANFESERYKIVEKKGNGVVIQSPEKVQYHRNVTEVKRFTLPAKYKVLTAMTMNLSYKRTMNRRGDRNGTGVLQNVMANGSSQKRKL